MKLECAFAALADETRLGLVRLLASGPRTATDLFTALGVSQPRASRHLRILREAGLIAAARNGRWVQFRIADGEIVTRLVGLVTGSELPFARSIARTDAEPGHVLPQASSAEPGGEAAVPTESARPPSPEAPRSIPPEPSPARRPTSSDIEEFLL